MDQRADIVDALRDVYDPCCEDRGLSVVDMGLIEDIRVEDGRASVDLVLTSGWCPFMVPLVETIRARVAAVSTVADADVRVVWDTAWTSGRLSPVARERLQFLPPPNQITGAGPVAAAAAPVSAHTTPEVTP
jgi:metal-sulfur cluster biosynthetic enzyme